jgi:chemotaxis family two-component system sensor kinase Cph1
MQQLSEFFAGLFATDKWPPRWKCGQWSDFHGWLYIVSDLMIWMAYFLIPLIIINYFNSKKAKIRFQKVYLLFAAFILLCGTTHFLDAVMFWEPMYRFSALVRFITGVVSLFTVYQLIQVLPQISRQRTNLELEKEIALREKVEKELNEANTRLAAFASIASHDLQEPVRKIRTFAGIVYSQNERTFDAASKLHTEKIISAAERMQSLIKDVLSLSTFSNSVKFGSVDLNEAVNRARENLELMITDKDAQIHVTHLPKINGNLDYLTQLFTNLLSNAIKFNDGLPVIRISATRTAGQLLVDIADNGIGLKTEHFDKIFDPFERAAAKKKYEGTGIGLAICKRIMEIHNGSITVESITGEGTTFTLSFPEK